MERLLRLAIFVVCILNAGIAFAAGGTCPAAANYLNPATGSLVTLSSLGVKSCFYFSKSAGSDTNSGTSETSPQAHLPGMPSYTGRIVPAAGQGFILKGGDTWVASDLDLYWQWTATANAPIYIGVDLSWYAGSSWARPVFTCGGGSCVYTANGHGFYSDQAGIQYVTVDNIEWTGLYQSTAGYPNYFSIYGSYNTFVHNYIHGWSHASAASGAQDNSAAFSPSTCCGGGQGNIIEYNVIDGADTTGDMLVCFYSSVSTVAYNICKSVTNGLEGSADNVHDNLIGPINMCFVTGGCHQNNLFQFGPSQSSSSPVFLYNNLIAGSTASGGITKFWMNGNQQTTSTVYAFNNLIYNNAPGNMINFGGHNAVSYGSAYFFNNTVQCGTDSAPGGAGSCGNDGGASPGETMTVNFMNNHWIVNGASPISCTILTCIFTTNLVQSQSAATAQGYNDTTQTFSFSPAAGCTHATCGTVQAGTNYQSLCTTIAGLNAAAGAACLSSTGYACTYNTSNHVVTCPAWAIPVARPLTWDIGAYQSLPGPSTPASGQVNVTPQ